MFFKNSVHQILAILSISLLCTSMVSADYSDNAKALELIDELVKEHDFDRASLVSLFAGAERKESILEAIARPAEKRLEWFEYQKIFITKDRIEKGRTFIREYLTTLEKAEEQFGVPKEVIAAIIGPEFDAINVQNLADNVGSIVQKLNSTYQQQLTDEYEAFSLFMN